MNNSDQAYEGQVTNSPVLAGFKGRCPRCGTGNLFNGYLTLAEKCNDCNLNNDYVDAADGPAVFVILVAGFIVVFMAMLVEIYYMPPYWLHALLWLPLGILIPLGMLRPLKGWFIAMQYRNSAKQAQFDGDGTEL